MSSRDDVIREQFSHAIDYAKRLGELHAVDLEDTEIQDQYENIAQKAARWWKKAYLANPSGFAEAVQHSAEKGYNNARRKLEEVGG